MVVMEMIGKDYWISPLLTRHEDITQKLTKKAMFTVMSEPRTLW